MSRLVHGGSATFDLDLPLTGTPAIECRRGNPTGTFSIVLSFTNNISNCGTTPNAGGSVAPGPNANQCTVNLTNVANTHTVTVELDNVVDTFGGTGNVSVPVGFLIGDTNKDGFVDAIDTAQTKSQSGHAVTQSNFREDVNVDAFIDAIDVALVKSKSGTVLTGGALPSGLRAPPASASKTNTPSRSR